MLVSPGMGVLSGLVEPVDAVAGIGLISTSPDLRPIGLAAGALLYVIVFELILETHASGNSRSAKAALVVGFILITVFNAAMAHRCSDVE